MEKKSAKSNLPTKEQVEKYELLGPMLRKILIEIKELSKKKQDGVLNKVKIRMINRILEEIKAVLVDEPTSQFLDLLDDETLPTNSDTVLTLAQFEAAMELFRHEYYNSMSRTWLTQKMSK